MPSQVIPVAGCVQVCGGLPQGTLRIFAKTLTGKTITLDLDKGATVQVTAPWAVELRPTVHRIGAVKHSRIQYTSLACMRNHLVSSCECIWCNASIMHTHSESADNWARGMQDVAEMNQQKDGIPPHHQRLIHGGQSLTGYSSRTLAELNIQTGDTVHLVLKIYGD